MTYLDLQVRELLLPEPPLSDEEDEQDLLHEPLLLLEYQLQHLFHDTSTVLVLTCMLQLSHDDTEGDEMEAAR